MERGTLQYKNNNNNNNNNNYNNNNSNKIIIIIEREIPNRKLTNFSNSEKQ